MLAVTLCHLFYYDLAARRSLSGSEAHGLHARTLTSLTGPDVQNGGAGRNVGGSSQRPSLIHEQEHDDWIHSLFVKRFMGSMRVSDGRV
jgi:hypothetical protein